MQLIRRRTVCVERVFADAAHPYSGETTAPQPDLDDILYVLAGFGDQDWEVGHPLADLLTDNTPICDLNSVVDLDDILAVLAAYGQTPSPCPDPCPCDPLCGGEMAMGGGGGGSGSDGLGDSDAARYEIVGQALVIYLTEWVPTDEQRYRAATGLMADWLAERMTADQRGVLVGDLQAAALDCASPIGAELVPEVVEILAGD